MACDWESFVELLSESKSKANSMKNNTNQIIVSQHSVKDYPYIIRLWCRRQNMASAQLPQPTGSQVGKPEEFWVLTPNPPGELVGTISLLFRPSTLSAGESYQPIVLGWDMGCLSWVIGRKMKVHCNGNHIHWNREYLGSGTGYRRSKGNRNKAKITYIYIHIQCGAVITRSIFFKILTIDTS